jgi:hypothetical protein
VDAIVIAPSMGRTSNETLRRHPASVAKVISPMMDGNAHINATGRFAGGPLVNYT